MTRRRIDDSESPPCDASLTCRSCSLGHGRRLAEPRMVDLGNPLRREPARGGEPLDAPEPLALLLLRVARPELNEVARSLGWLRWRTGQLGQALRTSLTARPDDRVARGADLHRRRARCEALPRRVERPRPVHAGAPMLLADRIAGVVQDDGLDALPRPLAPTALLHEQREALRRPR